MNKFDKKLDQLKKGINDYNSLAKKYGWTELSLKISDVDHSRTLNGISTWNDHHYNLKGGYTSCKKNVFALMYQHLFIMRHRYKKLQDLCFELSSLEYDMNYRKAVDKHNADEMNDL